jgi:lambda family phage minor tail protein L
MVDIREHVQGLDLGAEVTLVEIDLTAWGEGTMYWVLGDEGASAAAGVSFGGQTYTPFPFGLDGFKVTASGPLPRPNLVITDVGGIFTPLAEANDMFIGATVKRIVTYERFLDGEADEDPDSHKPFEEYIIAKLVKHVPEDMIQWELRAAMDVEESDLPGRQAVRDFCDAIPRTWDPVAEEFVYTQATCPFAEAVYLDENGDTVAGPEDEVFSKKLVTCCKARFGNQPLPFGGFPGLARIKMR